MNSAARAGSSVVYFPIDGLIASLEDALAEIAEIESRPLAVNLMKERDDGRRCQYEEMRACKCAVLLALRAAREYAKGPAR